MLRRVSVSDAETTGKRDAGGVVSFGLLARLVAAAPDDGWLVERLAALDWSTVGEGQLDRLCALGLISARVCDEVWARLEGRSVGGVTG